MYRYPILLCLLALFASACAETDNLQAQASPDAAANTGSDAAGSEFTQKGFALKIDPSTSLPQTCTPPFDPSCTALGPTDQLTCLPTGLNQGKCALYSSDDYSSYNPDLWMDPDATHTFTYISCPGSAASSDPLDPVVAADNAYCAGLNPFQDPEDYEAVCVVTEQTAMIGFGDLGRCAYFMKQCTPAIGTVCEASGFIIPGTAQCSAEADMTKAAMFETCADSVDNNCNGSTDEEDAQGCTSFWLDVDNDGFGTGASMCLCAADADTDFTATQGGDCDDTDASVNPNASESCNGTDDDCDGNPDNDLVFSDYFADTDHDGVGAGSAISACSLPMGATLASGDCNDNDVTVSSPRSYFVDFDEDNFGSTDTALQCASVPPAGYSTNNDDCNDNQFGIHAPNTFFVDSDGDGVGSSMTADFCEMSAPSGHSFLTGDCNDGDDTVDSPMSYSVDADGDGFGSSTTAMVCSSTVQPGYSANSSDCSDADLTVHAEQMYYVDNDGDGFGSTTTAMFCTSTPPTGHSDNDNDCDDMDSAIKPGAEDICNQKDDDCNGSVDFIDAVYQCNSQCPTVVEYECGVEYTVDFSTLAGSNTISNYNCWTSAGAKNVPTPLLAPELFAAPDAPLGTKYSFQFTQAGSKAIASMLHGTCAASSNAVTAYNPSQSLGGTCSGFGSTSVNGGVVGDDYVSIDKAAATGLVKFKFTCTPPTP